MKTKIKLNADFRKRWIKALRSGKFKQIEGALAGEGRGEYCVLGVAAYVLGVKKQTMILESAGHPRDVLTKEVMECSGIDKCGHMIGMNDEQGIPFKDMADYLEENTVPK